MISSSTWPCHTCGGSLVPYIGRRSATCMGSSGGKSIDVCRRASAIPKNTVDFHVEDESRPKRTTDNMRKQKPKCYKSKNPSTCFASPSHPRNPVQQATPPWVRRFCPHCAETVGRQPTLCRDGVEQLREGRTHKSHDANSVKLVLGPNFDKCPVQPFTHDVVVAILHACNGFRGLRAAIKPILCARVRPILHPAVHVPLCIPFCAQSRISICAQSCLSCCLPGRMSSSAKTRFPSCAPATQAAAPST